MKIVMFGHKCVPSREGGVEIVVEELASRMAALGHQVTCYNRAGQSLSGSAGASYRGIRLKTVATIHRKGLAAVSASFFAAILSACSDADVVHIHAEGPALMGWLPRFFGKRVIVTVHGLDWQREKWKGSLASGYIRLGERMAVRCAHEIIVLSRNVQNYFLDTYGRETVYIPNGVTLPEPVGPEQILELGLEKESYILFLGRLVPEKRPDLLIRAWKKANTGKKLVIAGGSSDSDAYVSELKKLACGDPGILFPGYVRGRLLEELFSNAYLYVLPSDLEGMPLSLLEAMSYGCCCLVSDIPECTEVVGHNALVFRAGEEEELREKLERLCIDGERSKALRSAARAHMAAAFSWDEVTKRTLELYQ